MLFSSKKPPTFSCFILESCTSSCNFILMTFFHLEHLSSPQQVTAWQVSRPQSCTLHLQSHRLTSGVSPVSLVTTVTDTSQMFPLCTPHAPPPPLIASLDSSLCPRLLASWCLWRPRVLMLIHLPGSLSDNVPSSRMIGFLFSSTLLQLLSLFNGWHWACF